jgi:hypothetical protein
MSGPTASQALQDRFDAIRRAELTRLKKKLTGLSEQDRQSVDRITTDIVVALTRGAARALTSGTVPPTSIDALIQLFALDL